MRNVIWIVAAVLATLVPATFVAAAPSFAAPAAGIAAASRPDVAAPLVEKVGHRHWRRFHAPYFGIYVQPRRYYDPYAYSYGYAYSYRYRPPVYYPVYYYDYAPPQYYYYEHRRRYHDHDWGDDDWDD